MKIIKRYYIGSDNKLKVDIIRITNEMSYNANARVSGRATHSPTGRGAKHRMVERSETLQVK